MYWDDEVISVSDIYVKNPDNQDNCINLLYFRNHYAYIKNINKLLSGLAQKKKIGCQVCGLAFFSNADARKNHEEICKNGSYKLPTQKHLQFTDYEKLIDVPFKIYADFETYFVNAPPEMDTVNMKFINEHRLMAWGLKNVNKYYKTAVKHTSVAECVDIEESFIRALIAEVKEIEYSLDLNIKIHMEVADIEDYESATNCFICDKPFDDDNDAKVRDHDHINGEYRGAAHNSCNFKYSKQVNFVPVIFHNLGGYDLHFILQVLGKYITCIYF